MDFHTLTFALSIHHVERRTIRQFFATPFNFYDELPENEPTNKNRLSSLILHKACLEAVSYTHLDVYKRQVYSCFLRWSLGSIMIGVELHLGVDIDELQNLLVKFMKVFNEAFRFPNFLFIRRQRNWRKRP